MSALFACQLFMSPWRLVEQHILVYLRIVGRKLGSGAGKQFIINKWAIKGKKGFIK